MGLKLGQRHVCCDMNAWNREPVDFCAKSAARIHERAAEAGLLRQPDVSHGDRGSISKGISESPNRPPESLLKNAPALRDLLPSETVWRPRQNRMGERMGADRHSRSRELPQTVPIKR